VSQLNFTKPQIAPPMLSFNYRVYYEDTDSGGVVYYANYLKYAERARTDFLRSLNINQSELAEKEGLVFVVRRCDAEYLSPARMDDMLEVSVEIKEKGASFVKIYQEIKLGEKVLNRLNVEIVCVDRESFKPKRIPGGIFG
jgi:acyl-CoA thioester hydrolase